MSYETEKKSKKWFMNVLSNQSQQETQVINELLIESASVKEEELELSMSDNKNLLFSKENQDKVSLDVIVAIESMLKDRQLQSYKNKGLDEQLNDANEMITRLKHEQLKKDELLHEKTKEIRELEISLTNKQMSYDQLLEDYKAYQLKSTLEYEKITNQLETEIAKYNKLYDESSNTQYQNMLKINSLQDKLRSMDIENKKYSEQYQKIVNEKADLMRSINDFTEKMSFSFTTKPTVSEPAPTE